MDRGSIGKLGLLVASALLIAACGVAPRSSNPERIAVVDWQRAVSGHPDYKSLEQGTRILKDLQEKRKAQENLARAQLGSLDKLRSLRKLSEASYWQADLNTRMVEMRERENKNYEHYAAQVEAEVDKELAPRKKAIEDSHQMEIFNLRARLETVKMRVTERKAVEEKLKEAQHERGRQVMALQAEKQGLMEAKLAPYREAMHKRMAEAVATYQAEILKHKEGKDKREQEMLSAAPKALNNALSIMDREIAKQQEKNDQLQKRIEGDITSQATRLAHEKGYKIIFKKYKVNISADDITSQVVANLPKQIQNK
ncbi:MAG: hypothetical protein ACI3WU_04385 [Phascolarctobacterium sp.]